MAGILPAHTRCSIPTSTRLRRVRLVVRTQPSQGWCTGSTPVRAARPAFQRVHRLSPLPSFRLPFCAFGWRRIPQSRRAAGSARRRKHVWMKHEDVFERHGFNKRLDHVASYIVKTLSTRVATCGGMGRSNDWRVPGIKRRLTRPVYED